jgi:hypothetical protein
MPPEEPKPPGWVDKYVDNPNNVVMGLANTYPWGYVRRFVCSLRATGMCTHSRLPALMLLAMFV